MNKKNSSLLSKLQKKYRLELLDEISFSTKLSFRTSRLYIILIVLVYSIVIVSMVVALMMYTPLKIVIPGYPDRNTRLSMERNAFIADSLINELKQKEQFFNSIKNVISGNDFKNSHLDSSSLLTPIETKQIEFSRSKTDSLFRKKYEEKEKYNLRVSSIKKNKDLSSILFYAPIEGIISTKFNPKEKHFGVDIISSENNRVSAILEGTVIFSGWTLDTGYVLQIQHSNNLISVYKHNSELLKKEGTHVKAGEAIALLGNSGELTSGPHLHFEMWHEGIPLNPQDYIKF